MTVGPSGHYLSLKFIKGVCCNICDINSGKDPLQFLAFFLMLLLKSWGDGKACMGTKLKVHHNYLFAHAQKWPTWPWAQSRPYQLDEAGDFRCVPGLSLGLCRRQERPECMHLHRWQRKGVQSLAVNLQQVRKPQRKLRVISWKGGWSDYAISTYLQCMPVG